MTPLTRRSHAGATYTPDATSAPVAPVSFFSRFGHPGDWLAILALCAAALSAFGWRYRSLSSIDDRVTAVEHRVDTLSTALTFTNYLQCVQLRTTDPVLLPPGCAPIIEKFGARK